MKPQIPSPTPTSPVVNAVPAQLVSFKVGTFHFGVNVAEVQEIIRHQPLTPVPLAPSTVRGLVNLRGQIITAIDMRALLQMDKFEEDSNPMNVVVNAGGEVVSLLIDGIGDVIDVDPNEVEATPETVPAELARLTSGVVKLPKQLLLVLNTAVCMEP